MQTEHKQEESIRGDVIANDEASAGKEKRVRGGIIQELKIIGSHSGCDFELDKDGRLIKHQNDCIGAMKMQQNYDGHLYRRPYVYWFKKDYFCMEYLPNAVPMAQWVSGKNIRILEREAHRMVSEVFMRYDNDREFNGARFADKIFHVISRLKKDSDIKLAESVASKILCNYKYPYGKYHGDLTMANILYDKDQPYLIDFLPGYIQSPVLDIAKLKQEYKLHWCAWLMKVNKDYYIFTEILHNVVEATFRSMDTRMVEAINLLRILPYVTSENIHKILTSSIENLCSQL